MSPNNVGGDGLTGDTGVCCWWCYLFYDDIKMLKIISEKNNLHFI